MPGGSKGYVYVSNNPATRVDPLGLEDEKEEIIKRKEWKGGKEDEWLWLARLKIASLAGTNKLSNRLNMYAEKYAETVLLAREVAEEYDALCECYNKCREVLNKGEPVLKEKNAVELWQKWKRFESGRIAFEAKIENLKKLYGAWAEKVIFPAYSKAVKMLQEQQEAKESLAAKLQQLQKILNKYMKDISQEKADKLTRLKNAVLNAYGQLRFQQKGGWTFVQGICKLRAEFLKFHKAWVEVSKAWKEKVKKEERLLELSQDIMGWIGAVEMLSPEMRKVKESDKIFVPYLHAEITKVKKMLPNEQLRKTIEGVVKEFGRKPDVKKPKRLK